MTNVIYFRLMKNRKRREDEAGIMETKTIADQENPEDKDVFNPQTVLDDGTHVMQVQKNEATANEKETGYVGSEGFEIAMKQRYITSMTSRTVTTVSNEDPSSSGSADSCVS